MPKGKLSVASGRASRRIRPLADKWQAPSTQHPAHGALLCHKCGRNSIPAPEGATLETRYVCPACSGSPEAIDHFDRYAFDDPGNEPQIGSDALVALDGNWESVARRGSLRLLRAKRHGVPWAIAATIENLRMLTNAERRTVILLEFCELTTAEAAIVSRSSSSTIRVLTSRAKKKLCAVNENAAR